jgi:site-specific DNA-methyltransferase (adenine-specific)
MNHIIHTGSNLDVLPTLPENSVDAIVTDPPYELGFMGKSWDSTGIAYNVGLWRECLRVLKPGGHILAFSGSRTYHRMACAIEDAGFEIRDQMMWVYGSGFPKSLNVAKAVDAHIRCGGSSSRKLRQTEQETGGESYELKGVNNGILGEKKTWDRKEWKPTTEQAKPWDGWGTALKPAHEPIVLARKPLEGTVANNVLKWGVGGINIDATRVCVECGNDDSTELLDKCMDCLEDEQKGRFPANLMHDGSQQVLDLFPNSVAGKQNDKRGVGGIWGSSSGLPVGPQYADRGSAARFFYCPKASKSDRDEGCDELPTKEKPAHMRTGNGTGETSMTDGFQPTQRKNTHPTVKPTELMRYLCRLITPPGGTVLDPFNGSGSTGKAAILEGFNYIGIELSPEYVAVAEARINAAKK